MEDKLRENTDYAPICLFVYNRPIHTLKTLKALSKNVLAKDSTLYVFCDGPKNDSSNDNLDNISEVRKVVKEEKWCGTVIIYESEINKGLANSIIFGVDEKPYVTWDNITGLESKPRFDLLPTGCGGVLYPKDSFHLDVLNEELFTKLCYDADDIWLNCMAFLKKTPIIFTGKHEYFLAVKSFKNEHLHAKNIGKSNNDYRMSLVKNYYYETLGINIFNRGENV